MDCLVSIHDMTIFSKVVFVFFPPHCYGNTVEHDDKDQKLVY